jgi:hypothetical protein
MSRGGGIFDITFRIDLLQMAPLNSGPELGTELASGGTGHLTDSGT